MQREKWSTQIGFILAAAGSAIGLGTLWKFPYVAGQNGGGLFLIFYLLCIGLIAIPVFAAELIIGKSSQRGAVESFIKLAGKHRWWKAAGWCGVASSFLIMSYYSVVAGWGLSYILMSLNRFYTDKTPHQIEEVFNTLANSGDISLFWHFVFTALTTAIVLRGIRNGVEKWSKIMTMALFTLLGALFLYSISLEGFNEAAGFLFIPDFSCLKPSCFIEALGLAFFTLSLGQGIMITYGSYLRKSDNIPLTSLLIGSSVPLVAVMIALTLFPIVFTFHGSPESGPGLIFKTLPLLFSRLPGSLILATGFFILFVFTALTSAIAFLETISSNLIDLYGWSRKRAVLTVGTACFLFGIPCACGGPDGIFSNWEAIYGKTYFTMIDSLVSDWLLPVGGFLVAAFAGWSLDQEAAKAEFQSKVLWLWKPWRFALRWIVPAGILLVLFQQSGLIDLDNFFIEKS